MILNNIYNNRGLFKFNQQEFLPNKGGGNFLKNKGTNGL